MTDVGNAPEATRLGPDVEGSRGMTIPLARPWIGEEEVESVVDVIRSRWWVQGPRVADFEEEFAAMMGASHAIAVNSGSSALLVAMAALEIGAGDEIISPDMTFVSTASAAMFLGARPVFVDIESEYHGMDPSRLEGAITPRTRAIVPVHYAGHSAEMGAITTIAERHGVPILEDAAESHLARYQSKTLTGRMGRIGIFSFTPSKPMTTGEGGMIVTDDAALASRCRRFRNFGDHGKFDWAELGFNFRMPEVMAAIGRVQLGRLEECVRLRREIGRRYSGALSASRAIQTPKERTAEDGNYQLYTILIREESEVSRDELQAGLSARGIGNRVYYPAMHRQGVFAQYGPFSDADYPNALRFDRSALSLPIYPELTSEDQHTVIEAVLEILGR